MLKTVEDLQRSNFLIHALGKVSAEVAKVSTPQQVLNTLRDEISRLDLNFIYLANDADQNYSSVVYTSLNLDIIKPLEKIAGQSLIGFTIPRSEWPPIIDQIDPEYPLFVDNFVEAIRPAYAQFPDSLVNLGLKTFGITEEDSGIFNPISFTDQSSGILVTWGKSLQEQDLQAFSIFGSQIGSSLEQAKLIELENKQLQELERSNSLVLSLSKIAADASSSFVPTEVLHSLAAELKGLGLDYYLCLVDKEQKEAEIAFVSPDTRLLKRLEKIFNASVVGFNIPRESWPEEAATALHSKTAVYVEDFYQDAKELFNKFPDKLAHLGLEIIGIDESTSGVHVATELHDGTIAIFSVWGSDLRESDLATFSIYANQISNSFEQARLIAAEQIQTKNLLISNTFLEALGHVAAKVATSIDPDSILKTLGKELLNIGIECLVVLLDEETNEGYIRYHSMNSAFIQKANKMTGIQFSTNRQPLDDFPPSIRSIFETNQPCYFEDFRGLIKSFIGTALPNSVANKATGLVGITADTRGVFLPLSTSENVFGCLSLWSDNLSESNLSTFSVFSNQIAIAFQNARLFESERKQASDLQISNSHLKALSRIASRLSFKADQKELISIIDQELKTIDLDFAFLSILNDDEKAVIEHISIDSGILKKIRRDTKITIRGGEIPQEYYPQDGITSFRMKETVYIADLQKYLLDTFRRVPKKFIIKALRLSGITEDTHGMFLPIILGDGSAIVVIIWGSSLHEENLTAFKVYATQVESKLESSRLYRLAQQEIMDRKLIEEELLKTQIEYQGLFENAHDAIIISDPSTHKILHANERALDIFGYSADDFTEILLSDLSSNIGEWKKYTEDIIRSKQDINFEINQFRKGHKKPMVMEVNAGVVVFNGREAIQSIHRDVTDRKELEQQLTHEVVHDTLTTLPNRLLFFDRLEHTIVRNQRTKDFSFAVLFIDLDRFKDVNDNHGHLLGDEVLIEIAKRIKMCVRGADTVARFGGDEFVILQENTKSPQDSSILCERILDHIEQPIFIGKSEIKITASIGIVVANPTYSNAEQYLRDADIAMYRAKELGKARYDYFNIDMRAAVIKRYELEKDIRKALKNNELYLVFQPILRLNDQKITGIEALIRWNHPERGVISPAEFIPVAENIGAIHEIGQWVLKEACATLNDLQKNRNCDDHFTLNVNVSPIQLLRKDFPTEVKQIIQMTKIDPLNLALEITETAFINDQENAVIQVDRLKEIGVQIHLDDFGTGYSSLSFINLLNIDCLKIEKQFISGMSNNKQRNLISAILALGEKLDLSVIAEGIELEKQHKFLQEIGCLLGQGYYYSKPVAAEKLAGLIHPHVKLA